MQFKVHPAIASQHYRMLDLQCRLASVSSHDIVAYLHEELSRSLDLVVAASTHTEIAECTQLGKAMSIIVVIRESLDFVDHPDLAAILYRIYGSVARNLNDAARNDDIDKIEHIRETVRDIAQAWQTLA